MPVIVAKHAGRCSACGEGIIVGEQVDYDRARGARHLACMERDAQPRRNAYRTRCHWCRTYVPAQQGVLKYTERQREDGTFERLWIVECLDAAGCSARCGGAVVKGIAVHHRHQ